MTYEAARPAVRSEKGMALIMVLLLLAVVSSLAAGLTMNSQVEVSMASNETSYAGARAAAEAGMNRAIAAIVDPANNQVDLLAEALAAGGRLDFLFDGEGPYLIGVNSEYSYVIELFDDDDPSLYPTPLSGDQLAAMNEDGDPTVNGNERLILRVTGFGPNGTTVRVGRIVETVANENSTNTTTNVLLTPALLVNGDLTVNGNVRVTGSNGTVHANGNLSLVGNWLIEGDAHAAGLLNRKGNGTTLGEESGSKPTITVPNVDAARYQDQATHRLENNQVHVVGGATCDAPCLGWSFVNGEWRTTGGLPSGTYFADASVKISGNVNGGGTNPLPLTVIALGSIDVSGNVRVTPHHPLALQFVTNGDLKLAGNLNAEDPEIEGQSLVREQLSISGNPRLAGQIIVQDFRDCGQSCHSLLTENSVSGNVRLAYEGNHAADDTAGAGTPGTVEFTNNVTGWLEGL